MRQDREAMHRIAEVIKAARLERGWTQVDLAAAAGTSRTTVARIETGYGAAMPSLSKVAKVLGLKVSVSVERTQEA